MSVAVSWGDAAFLLVAGFLAGITGTVAGLASLVSYPALLAVGLPPVAANVTNTVGLVGTGLGAAAGSRLELAGQAGRVRRLAGVTAAGGAAGAALLLLSPAAAFEIVVPFLVAGAACVLLLQPRLRAWMQRHRFDGERRALSPWMFAIAVYGGYFGAAAGVLMLALLATTVQESLIRANALKNVLLGAANAVAAVGFAVFGPVAWVAVMPLLAGLLAGGWTGPAVARRIPAGRLRVGIGVAGLALSVKLFLDAM